MSGHRVAIVGSRHYPRPELITAFVAALPAETIIVSGGAPGADTFAEEAAIALGMAILIFRADWEALGRKAGPIRNEHIVDAADRVVAFWDGQSRGTLHTVVIASERGKPVQIFDGSGMEVPRTQALAEAEHRGALASMRAAKEREQTR